LRKMEKKEEKCKSKEELGVWGFKGSEGLKIPTLFNTNY
jgi:hypothetical protein